MKYIYIVFNTSVVPAHFVVFLVTYAHQDKQPHSFYEPPSPKVHDGYKQWPISADKRDKQDKYSNYPLVGQQENKNIKKMVSQVIRNRKHVLAQQ